MVSWAKRLPRCLPCNAAFQLDIRAAGYCQLNHHVGWTVTRSDDSQRNLRSDGIAIDGG